MFHVKHCHDTDSLSSLQREISVLRSRLVVARGRGLPTTELEAQLVVLLTNLETEERLRQLAESGYRPVAVT